LFVLAAVLFAALPTIASYQLYSFRWVCRRSGPRANQCYAERTLSDRLPGSRWDSSYPRVWFMQIVAIADLERASPSKVESGVALLWPDVESCKSRGLPESWYSNPWRVPVVLDDRDPVAIAATVDAFTGDFNDFLRDKKRDAFVLQPAAPLRGWRSGWYAAYVVALAFSIAAFFALRRN
jgi:hypothetical protein